MCLHAKKNKRSKQNKIDMPSKIGQNVKNLIVSIAIWKNNGLLKHELKKKSDYSYSSVHNYFSVNTMI